MSWDMNFWPQSPLADVLQMSYANFLAVNYFLNAVKMYVFCLKDELASRLREMEENRTTETENYWLIQYQKLLDSRPKVTTT